VTLYVTLYRGRFAVCRLEAAAPVPPWAASSTFLSITRTASELSIVCDEVAVPGEAHPGGDAGGDGDVRADGVRTERGWRCLEVGGPIPFETTGVAAALTAPLAAAAISVFLISTFDTDYLLVKDARVDEAMAALRAAGFMVSTA